MVRKTDSGEKGRVKLRIVDFDLEGSDATLQESLRGLSALMNRVTGTTPTKRMDVLTAGPRPGPKNGNGHATAVVEGDADGHGDEIEDVEAEESEQASASSSTQRKRPTVYPKPEVLDIDFNKPEVSLKAYMDEKKPDGHNMKFLAVAAWFDQHGNEKEINLHHVYSAYQAMGWKSRKNMVQPFYALAKKGWVKQEGQGWAVTHIGRDRAKELPGGAE